jgi:hypothetical protein
MNYGLPDKFIGYISKLLTEFWTVGPLHPALVEMIYMDMDSEAEEDEFKLYVRMRKTTVSNQIPIHSPSSVSRERRIPDKFLEQVGALCQIIAKLKRTRPVNSPSLIAMEASLSGFGPDAVFYEKYIGEIIRSSSGRKIEDLHSASSGKGGGKT